MEVAHQGTAKEGQQDEAGGYEEGPAVRAQPEGGGQGLAPGAAEERLEEAEEGLREAEEGLGETEEGLREAVAVVKWWVVRLGLSPTPGAAWRGIPVQAELASLPFSTSG